MFCLSKRTTNWPIKLQRFYRTRSKRRDPCTRCPGEIQIHAHAEPPVLSDPISPFVSRTISPSPPDSVIARVQTIMFSLCFRLTRFSDLGWTPLRRGRMPPFTHLLSLQIKQHTYSHVLERFQQNPHDISK